MAWLGSIKRLLLHSHHFGFSTWVFHFSQLKFRSSDRRPQKEKEGKTNTLDGEEKKKFLLVVASTEASYPGWKDFTYHQLWGRAERINSHLNESLLPRAWQDSASQKRTLTVYSEFSMCSLCNSLPLSQTSFLLACWHQRLVWCTM